MPGKQAEKPTAKETREDLELRLAKAMAHPVRVKALELMNERPIAPVEVSEAIGVELSNVSYHFRTLLELDCIEPVETKQVRGSIKTTYKSKVRLMFDDMVWSSLGSNEKESLSGKAVGTLISRTLDSFEANTFDAKDNRHMSVSTVQVDWEGWDEITEMLTATMHRVSEIQAESATRTGESDVRFPATVGLMGFESPRTYE
jgi:DNA-binding transcriptional ArsR family regulator